MLYFLIVLSVISLLLHNKIGNYANFEIRGQTEALNYQYVVAKIYMIRLKKSTFLLYTYTYYVHVILHKNLTSSRKKRKIWSKHVAQKNMDMTQI